MHVNMREAELMPDRSLPLIPGAWDSLSAALTAL
jgi:hypothetical protein